MNKGLLLYTGYNGYSGTRYYNPTDEELRLLLAATDEILLIPIVMFNRFTDKDGNECQVITEEVIANLTADMVADPDRLEDIRAEYAARAVNYLRANYHVDDYINDAADYAKRLIAINPDVKLWFSVPQEGCLHALTHLYADAWVSAVHRIKEVLEPGIWEKNVQGIYFSLEDVVSACYTKFDPSCPEEDFRNPIVYSMRKVSEAVHAYGKNMLWIPYYDSAASSCMNLGHVANLTDIFDTVIIQPNYFFNAVRFPGMEIVKACAEKQAVVDKDGNIIGGEKRSKTAIGFEMEIDWEYFEKPEHAKRYQAYEETFGELVGKYPTAYYAGCPDTAVKLHELIRAFLKRN